MKTSTFFFIFFLASIGNILHAQTCQAFFQYTLGECPAVTFFDGSTTSSGSIISWFYDFGDGNTSTTQNAAHTYAANDTFTVCLTITTDDACTATYCDDIIISCITTGLTENQETSIQILPNPASEFIYLQSLFSDPIQYVIYNLNGVEVKSGKTPNNNNQSISINSLTKGLYIIKLGYNDKTEILRFIKS